MTLGVPTLSVICAFIHLYGYHIFSVTELYQQRNIDVSPLYDARQKSHVFVIRTQSFNTLFAPRAGYLISTHIYTDPV